MYCVYIILFSPAFNWYYYDENAQVHSVETPSCEIVAHRENFIDRPESYDLFSAKKCIFLAHEKTRTVWGAFLLPHTQPAPSIPTTLVPSLTLQLSDIVQSSLESPTLEFSLIICYIRDLNVWSRSKGKSSFAKYLSW